MKTGHHKGCNIRISRKLGWLFATECQQERIFQVLLLFVFSVLLLCLLVACGNKKKQLSLHVNPALNKNDSALQMSPAPEGDTRWKTYTHPELGFSIKYPSKLQTISGNPHEETVPSQEFEWRFPDSHTSIYLGLYDRPKGRSLIEWAQDFEGKIESITIGDSIHAVSRESLSAGVYQKEILIDDRADGFVVGLLFSVSSIRNWNVRPIRDIKKGIRGELKIFKKMVNSFRFKPEPSSGKIKGTSL